MKIIPLRLRLHFGAACAGGVSRKSVLKFSADLATNSRGGGFVRAVRCLAKVQTEIAFAVSLLVDLCSLIVYIFRLVLCGSKLPKSAVRGVTFKFVRAVLSWFSP